MNVPFFRKRTANLAEADPLLDWDTVADGDETVIASLNGTVPITERPTEPIGKAPFGRIGLVSVEEDASNDMMRFN